ncbi:MAG: sugar transporter [Flavobacteriia bacterium]|nr:MAG: sugar transporter [Flavobacteriia bacterium]
MLKILIRFLLLVPFISSCVAHKDIVYFQGEKPISQQINQVTNEPYRLKVDDIIRIDFKSDNSALLGVFQRSNAERITNYNNNNVYDYYNGYTVDKNGFVNIPLLGKINILGFTTDEVTAHIKEGLKTYFRDTSGIYVDVKLAGFKYTVLGEVSRTGTIFLYQNSVSIIEAIANAGDIQLTGNRKKVEILRKTKRGTKRFVVDLTAMDVFNSEHYYIQPNDVIYVPPIRQKTLGTGTNGLKTITSVVSVLSLLTSTILLIKNLK